MYKLIIKQKGQKGFATIIENGKAIEPLSGLYMACRDEILQLHKLVTLANESLVNKKEE